MLLNLIFCVVFIFQILNYWYLYKYFFIPKKINNNYQPAVSILICAKNEAENLERYLPKIAEQNYPNFEIIIIDDQSIDNTSNIIKELQHKYNNIKYLYIENKIGFGKKNIIEQGVQFANNELLLFTDADCFPSSKEWISTMCEHSIQHDIVLGISPYLSRSNTFLYDIQNYETTQTYLQYIALANAGKPYMCVGRNVMIKKSLYQQIRWTNEQYNLASGDDDLMIQQLANSKNTTTCIDEKSFTYSYAKDSFVEWYNQKLRHYTTGVKYKFEHQIILGLFLFTKLCFYLFILLNLSKYYFAYIFYIIILYTIFSKIEKKLIGINGLFKIVYCDIFTTFIVTAVGIISQLKLKKISWK